MAYNYTNPYNSPLFGAPIYPPVQQPTNDFIFVLDENAARSYPVGNVLLFIWKHLRTLWTNMLPRMIWKRCLMISELV